MNPRLGTSGMSTTGRKEVSLSGNVQGTAWMFGSVIVNRIVWVDRDCQKIGYPSCPSHRMVILNARFTRKIVLGEML